MKNISKILVVLSVVFLSSTKLIAQIDTVFWFAAPWVTPDHDQNTPLQFHFSTFNNSTTIRLRQPAGTYDTTFTVAANSLFSKDLSHIVNQVESKPADALLTSGFEITTTFPIICVYDFVSSPNNGSSNNPETYSLKGQNGIGYEFVVPFQTLWDNRLLSLDRNGDGIVTQPKQQFTVVATEDNTTIYITPRCDVIGHPANITYSISLPNKGNSYTCENAVLTTSSVPGSSMAGSIVVSSKKIAVIASDDSVNPSGGGGCFDLLGDQIVPTDVIGKEYNVNKGFLNAGSNESIFIVASKNFTSITIDDGTGVTTAIINQGETYQYSITEQLTNIKADKNVYVLHMSGYGCELGSAILPPLNCAGSSQVTFPRTNAQSFLLDIICPSGAEGNFTVNGDPTIVQAIDFSVVPGTGGSFMGAQIDASAVLPFGSNNIIINSTDLFSLGIINGSAATGCLYHYLSIFMRRVTVDAGTDTTLCSSTPTVNLEGSVSGGVTTGVWVITNGTGTLNNPTTLNTTYNPSPGDLIQGSLTFVLESTGNCDPIVDSLTITFAPSPEVTVFSDSALCKNNAAIINLSGSLSSATASNWTGGNGGAFGNSSNLNTTYTPSPADLLADSLVLYLSSLGSINSCPNDQDTLVIYFTPSPVLNPGSNQVICSSDDSLFLTGLVSGPTATGTWTTTGSGLFNPSADSLNTSYVITSADTASGTLWFTLTSTNNGNCLAVQDSIEITILDKPTVIISTSDSICSNAAVINLSGTVSTGFTTIWNVLGAGTVVTPSSLNTVYNVNPIDIANGFIDVILSTDIVVCSQEQDSIRIYFINPPIVSAGADIAFCDNQLVQLNGNISGASQTGSWASTGTGIFTPSSNLLTTFYAPSNLDITNGSVNLILSSGGSFGCVSDKDTLTVTFIAAPVANFSSTDACQNSPTSFTDLSTTTAGTINSWAWNFGDFTTSTNQNPNHSYATNGSLTVVLIVGATSGCFDTVELTTNVNPLPIVDFTNSTPCESNPTFFFDNSFISSGSLAGWIYDFDLNTSVSSPNTEFTYINPGNQSITYHVTSTLGCTDSITKIITVLVGPVAAFNINPNPALALQDVNFTDQTVGNQVSGWLWNFGDGTGDNFQNTMNNYADGGNYTVTLSVEDINGCTDTTSQDLAIILPPVLPTAFTPNGDGSNDVFRVRGGPFNTVIFNVYNNWGELIFQTDHASVGWDGTYQGNNSPLGVYTWTFEIEIAGGEIIKKSGDVTLIR